MAATARPAGEAAVGKGAFEHGFDTVEDGVVKHPVFKAGGMDAPELGVVDEEFPKRPLGHRAGQNAR